MKLRVLLHLPNTLRTFATDATSQLDVLGHDSNTLGVDGTKICVFKESNQIRLRSFLQRENSRT